MSESSSDEEVDENDFASSTNQTSPFSVELADWAIHCGIAKNHLNSLLRLLKKHSCFKNLPTDSRTLLLTPKSYEIKSVLPGQYFHFGLEKSISDILKTTRIKQSINFSNKNLLKLQINIDGIPLTKSSGSQFWPILGSLDCYTETPFIIGIYHGLKKPECSNMFLEDFVVEARNMIQNGMCVMNKMFDMELSCVICDAPAKAFVKKVKGHTGYFGCDRCTQKGQFVEGRTTFPESCADLRTDEGFAEKQQRQHHTGNSILETIPGIQMVSHFPHDYMHLVCLGAMRKLLLLWVKGNLRFRLSHRQKDEISTLLVGTKSVTPKEFQRKPRALSDLDRWKATELRQFLLYTGPLVLKSVLHKKRYTHFLSLSSAIRILADPEPSDAHRKVGRNLLNYFFQHYADLYGHEQVSYNVHSLIHLADDVDKFGALDSFSAFKFENYLQKVKKMVKSSALPLPQIIRRVYEQRLSGGLQNFDEVQQYPILKELSGDNTILCDGVFLKQYKAVVLPGLTVTTQHSDNCVQLKNGEIVVVEGITKSNLGKITILGRKFLVKSAFFNKPYDSREIGIFKMKHLSVRSSWDIDDVKRKAMKVPLGHDEFYVASLLHN